jgi:hypothetical protein
MPCRTVIRAVAVVRYSADRSWCHRECFAGWQHVRLVRELDRGETAHFRPLVQAVAMAFFLALVGLAMAIYLVSVSRRYL